MAYLQIHEPETNIHFDLNQLKAQKSPHSSNKSAFTSVASETRFNYKRVKALVCQPEISKQDAKLIYTELQNFNFFTFLFDKQNFIEEDAIKLCQYLRYESHKAGTTIYSEGQNCNFKTYLVLSGEISKAVKKLDYYSAQNLSKLQDKFKVVKNANHVLNEAKRPQEKKMLIKAKIKKQPTRGSQELAGPVLQSPTLKRHSNTETTSTNLLNSPPQSKRRESKFFANPLEFCPVNINDLDTDQGDILKKISEDASVLASARHLGENAEAFDVARLIPPGLDVGPRNPFKKRNSFVAKEQGVVVDTKKVGDYFGESAMLGTKTRGETIVTVTDCELLVIDRDAQNKMKNQFEDTSTYLWDFLIKYMPGLDKIASNHIAENLIHLLEPKILDKGSVLTQEGEKGFYFYIIKEGECEAYKSWTSNIESHHKFKSKEIEQHYGIDKTITEQLKIYLTTPGNFVGEEILYRADGCYDFTVKITTFSATVYMIEKNKFALRFPNDVFMGLKKLYEQKSANNDKVYQQKINFYLEEFNVLHQSHLQTDKLNINDLPQLPTMEIKKARFRPMTIGIDTPPRMDSPNRNSPKASDVSNMRRATLSPEEQEMAKKLKTYQRAQPLLLPMLKLSETPRNNDQQKQYTQPTREGASEIMKFKYDFGDNYDQRRLDILSNHLRKVHNRMTPGPKMIQTKMETLPRASYEERGEIIASNLLIASARLWTEEDQYEKSISSKAVFSSKTFVSSPRFSAVPSKKERPNPLSISINNTNKSASRLHSPLSVRSQPFTSISSNFGSKYTDKKAKTIKKVEFKPRVIQGVIRKIQK